MAGVTLLGTSQSLTKSLNTIISEFHMVPTTLEAAVALRLKGRISHSTYQGYVKKLTDAAYQGYVKKLNGE